FLSDLPMMDSEEEEEKESASSTKTEKVPVFVFYDFEATQEKLEIKDNGDMENEHQGNYAVAKQRSEKCICPEYDNNERCDFCGIRKHVFTGEDALGLFCEYVFSLNLNSKLEVTAIAHNSSGYDAQFILQHCLKHNRKPEKCLVSGTKITYMLVRGVRFVDSCRFLPMPLSKFPDAFALTSNLKNGDFPHFFNLRENWDYVGPLPDFKYFGAESRSPEEKVKLYKWWKQQRDDGYEFDFQKEIKEYCENDVNILEAGCLKFR